MILHKNSNIHWSVIAPSLAVLALVAITIGSLAFFVGRTGSGREEPTAEAVAIRYAADIAALKRDVAASSEAPGTVVERAEDTLLSIRVPKERLDAHLASVIQLRALGRALPTMEANDARARLAEILHSL